MIALPVLSGTAPESDWHGFVGRVARVIPVRGAFFAYGVAALGPYPGISGYGT